MLVGEVERVAPVVRCAGVESLGVGALFVAVVIVPEPEVSLGFQVAGFPLLLAVVPRGVEACLAGGVVSGQILPAAPVSAQRGFALVVEVVDLPEGGEREPVCKAGEEELHAVVVVGAAGEVGIGYPGGHVLLLYPHVEHRDALSRVGIFAFVLVGLRLVGGDVLDDLAGEVFERYAHVAEEELLPVDEQLVYFFSLEEDFPVLHGYARQAADEVAQRGAGRCLEGVGIVDERVAPQGDLLLRGGDLQALQQGGGRGEEEGVGLHRAAACCGQVHGAQGGGFLGQFGYEEVEPFLFHREAEAPEGVAHRGEGEAAVGGIQQGHAGISHGAAGEGVGHMAGYDCPQRGIGRGGLLGRDVGEDEKGCKQREQAAQGRGGGVLHWLSGRKVNGDLFCMV